MKYIEWDDEKNKWLKEARGISFDEIKVAIENKQILDVVNHPNQKKYPGQQMFILEVNKYVYVVPYAIDEKRKVLFLKTAYPSRKLHKKYLKGE